MLVGDNRLLQQSIVCPNKAVRMLYRFARPLRPPWHTREDQSANIVLRGEGYEDF
jgi:hypothetical protein